MLVMTHDGRQLPGADSWRGHATAHAVATRSATPGTMARLARPTSASSSKATRYAVDPTAVGGMRVTAGKGRTRFGGAGQSYPSADVPSAAQVRDDLQRRQAEAAKRVQAAMVAQTRTLSAHGVVKRPAAGAESKADAGVGTGRHAVQVDGEAAVGTDAPVRSKARPASATRARPSSAHAPILVQHRKGAPSRQGTRRQTAPPAGAYTFLPTTSAAGAGVRGGASHQLRGSSIGMEQSQADQRRPGATLPSVQGATPTHWAGAPRTVLQRRTDYRGDAARYAEQVVTAAHTATGTLPTPTAVLSRSAALDVSYSFATAGDVHGPGATSRKRRPHTAGTGLSVGTVDFQPELWASLPGGVHAQPWGAAPARRQNTAAARVRQLCGPRPHSAAPAPRGAHRPHSAEAAHSAQTEGVATSTQAGGTHQPRQESGGLPGRMPRRQVTVAAGILDASHVLHDAQLQHAHQARAARSPTSLSPKRRPTSASPRLSTPRDSPTARPPSPRRSRPASAKPRRGPAFARSSEVGAGDSPTLLRQSQAHAAATLTHPAHPSIRLDASAPTTAATLADYGAELPPSSEAECDSPKPGALAVLGVAATRQDRTATPQSPSSGTAHRHQLAASPHAQPAQSDKVASGSGPISPSGKGTHGHAHVTWAPSPPTSDAALKGRHTAPTIDTALPAPAGTPPKPIKGRTAPAPLPEAPQASSIAAKYSGGDSPHAPPRPDPWLASIVLPRLRQAASKRRSALQGIEDAAGMLPLVPAASASPPGGGQATSSSQITHEGGREAPPLLAPAAVRAGRAPRSPARSLTTPNGDETPLQATPEAKSRPGAVLGPTGTPWSE